MNTPPTPINFIRQRPAVLFDILAEHAPPGTEAGDDLTGVLLMQVWVKKIAAHNPEEAGRKAEKFLTATKNVRTIRVVRWRFYSSHRKKGENTNDQTLFS